MPLTATCPKCSQQYQLPEQLAGKNVKCKACGAAFVVGGGQADRPAPATAARTPAVSGAGAVGVDGAAASELAKYGIDGPIVRTSTDVFADASKPARQAEGLGNFAGEDPGFANSPSAAGAKKKVAIPTPPPSKAAAKSASKLPFDNPHAATAASFAKQPKAKAADLQKEFERLDQAAQNHRAMNLGFIASIPIAPALLGIAYFVVWYNDYSLLWDREKFGLTDGLFYTVIGLSALAALIFLVTYFVFASGAVRLAKNLSSGTKAWMLHLALCLTIVGGIVSLIMLNVSARKQLSQAGFKMGLLGATASAER